MPDKIAIIGAGLVGSAWAIVFARAGHQVALYDGTEGQCETALVRIETNLEALEGPRADRQSQRRPGAHLHRRRLGRRARRRGLRSGERVRARRREARGLRADRWHRGT